MYNRRSLVQKEDYGDWRLLIFPCRKLNRYLPFSKKRSHGEASLTSCSDLHQKTKIRPPQGFGANFGQELCKTDKYLWNVHSRSPTLTYCKSGLAAWHIYVKPWFLVKSASTQHGKLRLWAANSFNRDVNTRSLRDKALRDLCQAVRSTHRRSHLALPLFLLLYCDLLV